MLSDKTFIRKWLKLITIIERCLNGKNYRNQGLTDYEKIRMLDFIYSSKKKDGTIQQSMFDFI